MKRRILSTTDRVRIFQAHGGRCCICGGEIGIKAWFVEHIKPLWLGGPDEEANMGPAHVRPCAVFKTKQEARVRAKTYRQRARHLGIKRRKGRPMPGTIASGWRKKFDGTVERR
jgi:hypothetical protein